MHYRRPLKVMLTGGADEEQILIRESSKIPWHGALLEGHLFCAGLHSTQY